MAYFSKAPEDAILCIWAHTISLYHLHQNNWVLNHKYSVLRQDIWIFLAGLSSSSGRNTAFFFVIVIQASHSLLLPPILLLPTTSCYCNGWCNSFLPSLKCPVLHSSCSGDWTVKRHEPFKYMWLLWCLSDMKHHPWAVSAFWCRLWLGSTASREQCSPTVCTVPFSTLPEAEITERCHTDQVLVRVIKYHYR